MKPYLLHVMQHKTRKNDNEAVVSVAYDKCIGLVPGFLNEIYYWEF